MLDVVVVVVLCFFYFFFFFKQKTAYEMRISDWSSDVCSSDLRTCRPPRASGARRGEGRLLWSPSDCPRLREPGPRRCRRVRRPQIGRASCRERVCQYV